MDKLVKNIKKTAWNAFSLFSRYNRSNRMGLVRCVTCGKLGQWKGDGMQAGHGIEGRCNSILFQQDIVWPQCGPCNFAMSKPKSKIQDTFTRFLIRNLGVTRWEELTYLKHQTWNLYDDDYQAIIHATKTLMPEVELLRWSPTRPPQLGEISIETIEGQVLLFRVDTDFDRHY